MDLVFWFKYIFYPIYQIKFLFFNHGVIVTGPADTVGPPPPSVILGVEPSVNVYLSVVVTVILKPEEFLYAVKATPPTSLARF